MKLTTLGNTSLEVTKFGLGMAAMGRPGYINLGHGEDLNNDHSENAMLQNAIAVIDLAWQKGIRYFDMARSYGKAEAFFSTWATNNKEKHFVVGSKWGYTYTANWQINAAHHEIKEHSVEKLNQQYQESKSLLGTSLNLYQIHSATLESGVLENHAVLERLEQIKAEGTAIGLSVSGKFQDKTIEKAIQLEIDGKKLFDTVQATYNILEQSTATQLQKAHDAGIGVIIKEGLANGRLTDKNIAETDATLHLINEKAKYLGTSIDALSLAFVLSQPFVDVVLSGAATLPHLLSNLNALDLDLSPDTVALLKKSSESPSIYWQKRKALPWN